MALANELASAARDLPAHIERLLNTQAPVTGKISKWIQDEADTAFAAVAPDELFAESSFFDLSNSARIASILRLELPNALLKISTRCIGSLRSD